MEIKVIPLGSIQANCYLITGEQGAVVIDPGFDSEIVTEFLNNNSDKERLILLTHAHFDHISGAYKLRNDTDTKIAIGEFDEPALSNPEVNLSTMFGVDIAPFFGDIKLADSQEFSVGDLNFKVIHTPGHTIGSVCYKLNELLFSGDTLFSGSIGRTDFPGGDFKTLEASINKLYTLSGDTVVLSGHGGKTTIDHEKHYNPFFRG